MRLVFIKRTSYLKRLVIIYILSHAIVELVSQATILNEIGRICLFNF